jgi:hypothetical protein
MKMCRRHKERKISYYSFAKNKPKLKYFCISCFIEQEE